MVKRIRRVCVPLRKKTVDEFITSLIDERKKSSYINKYIIVIRYWGECFHIPSLANYPYCKLRQHNDFVREIFTDKEIEAFLALPNPCKKKSVYWKRYKMWTLFWYINAYQGFRPGETIKFTRASIDLGRNVFLVHGKTGMRVVPISFILRKKLKDYLATLEGEQLFPPLHHRHLSYMTQTSWEADFAKRIARLGIKRPHLDPYSFRHSFGTRMAEEDYSLFKIQQAMGHRKVETTQKYMHMSLKGVEQMIDGDRLALSYKSGSELIKRLLGTLREFEQQYPDKLIIDTLKKQPDGRRVSFTIKAID